MLGRNWTNHAGETAIGAARLRLQAITCAGRHIKRFVCRHGISWTLGDARFCHTLCTGREGGSDRYGWELSDSKKSRPVRKPQPKSGIDPLPEGGGMTPADKLSNLLYGYNVWCGKKKAGFCIMKRRFYKSLALSSAVGVNWIGRFPIRGLHGFPQPPTPMPYDNQGIIFI